ncbi:flagellar basal body-associated protein FliL [Roseovarius spongiae]|uniref:Flagellar basal body-associated protein FliL n=1 Tax=Roseovarius spongiae TaxID=2320272 RepID=A0A3A8AS78_9RHOB|nr:flagellar basal body-associated FliL family protein [Roseovarius spongiae]RKF13042.1 flagellar basal body-associated protein FliL [Roseovarius spongiae]
MKKLLPLVLMLAGIGGGVGAGLALRPAAPVAADGNAADGEAAKPALETPAVKARDDDHGGNPADADYVKLNNQFVVPVVTRDKVAALVVMSLSIELAGGSPETVYLREPKLRDQFLQVLFDHANMGGFEGAFTSARKLDVLRAALLEVARAVIGPEVASVLITDINRQDA